MKHTVKNILLWVFLPIVIAACSALENYDNLCASSSCDLVQIQLGVRIPAPAVTRAMSDNENAVTESVEDSLGFVVFAFDPTYADGSAVSDPTLLWVLKSGDTNYDSNLSDHRDSPAIKWRSGSFPYGYGQTGDDAQYGTLYIEAPETDKEVELLVLANVNPFIVCTDEEENLVIGDVTINKGAAGYATLSTIETCLSPAFDYSTKNLTGTYGPATDSWNQTTGELIYDGIGTETSNYIPMAGRATLPEGIRLGSSGTVSLRRSLAKISVGIEYSSAELARFWPRELKIMNVNEFATVCAPESRDGNMQTNIPTAAGEEGVTYTAMTFFEDFPSRVSLTDALSVSAQLYVPETLAWANEGDNTTHLCVLVGGVFDSDGIYDSDGNINNYDDWKTTNPEWTSPLVWYRFDFIPSGADTTEEELTEIFRNRHYKFTVSNLAYLGSYTEEAALEMLYPDNYVISKSGEGNWTLYVDDEDINSVTVAFESASDGADIGINDYVGVSGIELTMELPVSAEDFTGNEATHLKMVTNYEDWTAAFGIDLGNCGGVFSFSFTEDEEENRNVYWHDETDELEDQYPVHSGILWIWADGLSGIMEDAAANDAKASATSSLYTNGALNVGKIYTFYICVGVVRKEIHIYPIVKE